MSRSSIKGLFKAHLLRQGSDRPVTIPKAPWDIEAEERENEKRGTFTSIRKGTWK